MAENRTEIKQREYLIGDTANKKIVKVSSKGKITAVKTGTTVVKAKIGKKVYT